MGRPSFARLWALYPTNIDPSNRTPCNGPWGNQCAIRMSICLNAEKSIQINSTTYSEPKCSHGHARGAESLANWLWKNHLRRPKIYLDGKTAKTDIKDKTGIIFFKDCFTRSGETRAVGDHIDLWNKEKETATYNDPRNAAQQIWFWELN